MSITDKYPEKDANYVNTVSSLVMAMGFLIGAFVVFGLGGDLTRSQLAGARAHLPGTLSILPHKTVQTTESQNKESSR